MTIGDYPEYLAIGYLLNQNMLLPDDEITARRLRRRAFHRRGAHRAQDQLRKEAEEEGADLRLRAGHRVRRPDGSFGKRVAAQGRVAHLLALRVDPQDQHHALALSGGRRHPRLRAGATGPAAGLYGRRRAPQRGRQDRRLDVQGEGEARRQDFLHHRTAHLRNGDQDRAHGHPNPDLALGLHRLGRRAGAQGQPHAGRARARKTLRRARRRGPHRVRPGPRPMCGRKLQAPAQGRRA